MPDDSADPTGLGDTVAAPPSSSTPTRLDTSPGPDSPRGAVSARYREGAVIGRGGMGEVVSALDEQIGRTVAIKRLRSSDASPEAVARFLREARIQGRLDHPSIVPVHELERDDAGQPFFVMKQLAGRTLYDVLADGDAAFTRQRLLRAFVDLCLAIEFAHTRGIVHRDLKPANVVLGDFGEVYVLDWGIARVVGEADRASFADIDTLEGGATMVGSVLGTPGYMSPEQVRGDADLDGRSDVYALGCILYEILAGKPLHPRTNAALSTALTGLDARPSRASADREVPPELDALCVAATALDRAERPASARALGDAVQRYLDGDRDGALRKQLAQVALADARAALDRNARTDALRAAARALALDPQAPGPAELVGRLMIEPPTETPPEVAAAVHAQDVSATQAQARLGRVAVLGYIAFLPLIYAAGFTDLRYHAAVAGLSVLTSLLATQELRRGGMSYLRWGVVASVVFVAVVGRMLTPFLLAPGIGILTAMLFAMHPTPRASVLYLAFVGALLAPWLGELAGLLTPTTTIVGDHIVLHGISGVLDPTYTRIGLTVYVVVAPAFAIWLARSIANDRRRAQRALELQAWQLRQLVPRA